MSRAGTQLIHIPRLGIGCNVRIEVSGPIMGGSGVPCMTQFWIDDRKTSNGALSCHHAHTNPLIPYSAHQIFSQNIRLLRFQKSESNCHCTTRTAPTMVMREARRNSCRVSPSRMRGTNKEFYSFLPIVIACVLVPASLRQGRHWQQL